MCGICGRLNFAKDEVVDRAILEAMTNVISHRGPDDIGLYHSRNVGLGMRRLSIIDLATGQQPIHNEDNSIQIVLNGEIYNFEELRRELEKKGHKFYTRSDTESIVHLYEEYGKECVHKLRGMFAFAIWDQNRQLLFIARDRLGIKPLYYFRNSRTFLFASEIKALLKDPSVSKNISHSALNEYLTYQYIPAPYTIFQNTYKLPQGHTITIENNEVEIEQYWKPEFRSETACHSLEEYKEKLLYLTEESVRMRLVSDVPLGAFLSGGLDSSGVVGIMSKYSSNPIKTFSVGFDVGGEKHNELKYARTVANHFNCDHHEIVVTADIAHALPEIIAHLDEPMSDAASIPVYFMSELARRDVTVVLTGEGADELLAGYEYYGYERLAAVYRKLPEVLRKKVIEGLFNRFPNCSFTKRVAQKLFRETRDAYIMWNGVFEKNEKDHLYTTDFKYNLHRNANNNRFDTYFSNKETDWLETLLNFDMNVLLPDDFLMKVDKMSMAHSLEARVPYLDHKLVEFILTIPSNLKLKGSQAKFILQKAYGNLLPKEILDRRKHGFDVPIGLWLRNGLRTMTDDLLSEDRIRKRGYFNTQFVKTLVEDYMSGKNISPRKIWSLLCLEIWHNIYVD